MLKKLPLYVKLTFKHDLNSAILYGIFGGAFLPFITIIGRKIGASEIQIAFLIATPYIANVFSMFWTEDLFGKGRVWYVVWPNLIGRGALFAIFFISDPFYYTIIFFLYMFISSAAFPSYALVMKKNYPDAERGRLMGYVRIGLASLWIISSMIAGWMLEKSTENYHYIFPIATIFGILSALEFGKIKLEGEERQKEGLVSFSTITLPFKNMAFRKFLLTYSIYEFGFILALPLYPLIQVDMADIPNFVAGIFGTIYSSFWLVGFFFWGRLMDKYSLQSILKLLFLVSTLLPIIYLLTNNLWFLAIAQGILGLISAAIELISFVVITRMASHEDTPRYMALHIFVAGIRGTIAPFLGPLLMNLFGAKVAFGVSTLFILSAFMFIKRNGMIYNNINRL